MRSRLRVFAWAGVLTIVLVFVIYHLRSSPSRPRLVLLYSTCTLNKDYLSPYNPRVPFTPHLEKFSRRSLVFTRHQTESDQSGVSFASLFSGTQSDRHGVYTVPTKLPDDVGLIFEAFRDAGYDVFAWLFHPMASVGLNYAQGVPPRNRSESPLTANDEKFRRILNTLRSDKRYKAFLVTNFTVTHGPYQGHALEQFCRDFADHCAALGDRKQFERYRKLHTEYNLPLAFDFENTVRRFNLTESEVSNLAEVVELLYKADVYYLDKLFGELIAAIERAGLLDDTVIAFTADHGEVLYRDDAVFKWSHSMQLAPEALGVPLIIHAPAAGIRPGRYEAVTRSIDVFPTLASLSGFRPPGDPLPGVDLSGAMRTGKSLPSLLAFSHTSLLPGPVAEDSRRWVHFHSIIPRADPQIMWVSVRSGDMVYKWISMDAQHFGARVYDLKADPMERRDLHEQDPRRYQEMIRLLLLYKERLMRGFSREKEGSRRPSKTRQRELLKSLGYVN